MSALRSVAKSNPPLSAYDAYLAADYDSAVSLLASDRSIDGDILLTNVLIRLARYDDAREVVSLSRGRRRPMMTALLAAADMRQGRCDEAQALLDATRDVPKSDRERDRINFEYAMLAFTRGDTDALEERLRPPSFGTMEQQAHELRGWLAVRQLRYHDAITAFTRAAIGPDAWTRYHALVAAAYLAREIYHPEAMRQIEALVDHVPTRHLAPLHFEIVRSSAWFLAMQDHFADALARLRQASRFVQNDVSRLALLIDRGYIALAFGERISGWEDLYGAAELARAMDWTVVDRDHRRHLLTLSALLADRKLFDARWCLRQYFGLKPTEGITEWSRDPRSEGFEAYARAAVARGEGSTQTAHAEFARAFQIFRTVGYDWRAVLTLLARRPSVYSQIAAPEYVTATLKRFPNSWLRAMVEREIKVQTEPAPIAALTPMQREILALIVQGQTNPEIARSLGRKPSTIAEHVTKILRVLGCKNRRHVARACAEMGYSA